MIDVQQFARDNAALVDQICDILITSDISPQKGEHVMLYLAGLSMGSRACSIAKDSIALEIFARAWQIGAANGE